MAKKSHHRKRGLPKTTGGWVSLAFKAIGAVVIAGPAINVLMDDIPKGTYQSIPNDMLFAYTGLGGTTAINTQQLGVGIGSIAGGTLMIYLGKFLGKMIR